tara:strand:- start:9161 stop:11026 length:1866 start_codon:yes stop_codon:yes gene_type:complete
MPPLPNLTVLSLNPSVDVGVVGGLACKRPREPTRGEELEAQDHVIEGLRVECEELEKSYNGQLKELELLTTDSETELIELKKRRNGASQKHERYLLACHSVLFTEPKRLAPVENYEIMEYHTQFLKSQKNKEINMLKKHIGSLFDQTLNVTPEAKTSWQTVTKEYSLWSKTVLTELVALSLMEVKRFNPWTYAKAASIAVVGNYSLNVWEMRQVKTLFDEKSAQYKTLNANIVALWSEREKLEEKVAEWENLKEMFNDVRILRTSHMQYRSNCYKVLFTWLGFEEYPATCNQIKQFDRELACAMTLSLPVEIEDHMICKIHFNYDFLLLQQEDEIERITQYNKGLKDFFSQRVHEVDNGKFVQDFQQWLTVHDQTLKNLEEDMKRFDPELYDKEMKKEQGNYSLKMYNDKREAEDEARKFADQLLQEFSQLKTRFSDLTKEILEVTDGNNTNLCLLFYKTRKEILEDDTQPKTVTVNEIDYKYMDMMKAQMTWAAEYGKYIEFIENRYKVYNPGPYKRIDQMGKENDRLGDYLKALNNHVESQNLIALINHDESQIRIKKFGQTLINEIIWLEAQTKEIQSGYSSVCSSEDRERNAECMRRLNEGCRTETSSDGWNSEGED